MDIETNHYYRFLPTSCIGPSMWHGAGQIVRVDHMIVRPSDMGGYEYKAQLPDGCMINVYADELQALTASDRLNLLASHVVNRKLWIDASMILTMLAILWIVIDMPRFWGIFLP